MEERERVNRLEDKIAHLEEKRLEHIEDEVAKISRKMDELINNQVEMDKQLERYSARWGAVLMVGSAMVAALKYFWNDMARIFGGK